RNGGVRAARVIGKKEEEGISLSQYEDRYGALLRDIATMTEHDEGMMREMRTAYLDEGRLSTDEVASLRAERDSAVEERDLIRVRLVPSSSFVAPTLSRPSFDRIRDLERRVDRYRSERNSARDECHEFKEDVKGLIDMCGIQSGILLAAGGNSCLADVNPYVRVPLPSSRRSQSQSRSSTQMMRDPRQV
ncbi:hypothetical protein AMTR_s00271p00013300, partial [Amborella trichopoda]